MKEQIPLKYACLDQFDSVLQQCENKNISNYLLSLKDLIIYQMQIIKEQRMEIVAFTHSKSWDMYK